MLGIASLFAAVVPMFTYLLLIWWMDRNEREPFGTLFLNFFWGATGAIVLGIIGSLIFQVPLSIGLQILFGGSTAELEELSGAIITAPIVEEFTKGIFLIIMASTRKFDGIVDGVVYGGAIGLGFGMTENFLYFVSYGTEPVSWIFLVIIRTLFSAVMHCMATATFGGVIGYAKFKNPFIRIILVPIGYSIAVFLHFSWNLSVSFEDTTLLGFLFLILYFFAWIAVFQIAIYMEAKNIKKELFDESNLGLIPTEHLKYLPYVLKRKRRGWVPVGINQNEYIKTSIQLAVRKYQARNLTGKRKTIYDKEVENLRYKIQMMFYNAHVQYYYKQNSL